MQIKIVPINMINSPNYWSPAKEIHWIVNAGQSNELWGQILIVDSLSTRPYIPPAGSTLSIVFRRPNPGTTVPQNLTVTKSAIFEPNFRAIIRVPLTVQESNNIVSGTVVFTLTEGSLVRTWAQNWFCKKVNTGPGF